MPGAFLCKEMGMKEYSLDHDGNLRLYTGNDALKELIMSYEVKPTSEKHL